MNVRGWSSDINSDNHNLRSICVDTLQLDIIGIAETHLTGSSIVHFPGYKWFGNNRKGIHVRARTGSGGVGFLIKENMCSVFDIEVLDNSFEGVLWLKMIHKLSGSCIYPCVCYLPPENSSRQTDVNALFDQLLTSIYNYQNDGDIFICGDFNSRCGDLDDFIAGVDDVPRRNVVDFKTNLYGEILIDFLIDTNLCILNGRNCLSNDFTSVSVKGLSVVDVSHECLSSFYDSKLFDLLS